MKILYTLFVLLLFTSMLSGQVVLQDYSNARNTADNDVFGIFGGGLAGGLMPSPTDAANQTAQAVNSVGGDVWKGTYSRPQSYYIDLTSNQSVSIKIYSNTVAYFKGKIQAGQSGQTAIELASSESHSGSGWETLTFTFTGATGEWGEFVVYTNVDSGGSFVDPAVNSETFYLDDISAVQGSAIPAPVVPTSAAPTPPARDAVDVISMFSNTYTDVTVDTWRTGWSNATLTDELISGNDTKKYTNLGFVGIETVSSPINASEMNYFHLDYWSPNMTMINIKLVDFLGDGFGGSGDTEANISYPVTQSAWTSLKIPLADLFSSGITSVADINQLIITSTPYQTGTLFVDNVYFSKEPTPTSSACSGAMDLAMGNPGSLSGLSFYGATASTGVSSSCDATANVNDVWLKVTSDSDGGMLDIAITGSSVSNIVATAYSGTCGALVEQGCSDGTGMLSFTASAKGGDDSGDKKRTDDYYIRLYEKVPSGSTFSVAASGAALLPIELVSFNVDAVKAGNEISWSTASEIYNQYQAIEKSSNGNDNWVEIARVESEGSVNNGADYQIMDTNPYTTSFYRLKSYDYDGSVQLSHVVSVERQILEKISVFPNPAMDIVNVELYAESNGDIQIDIFDITGRKVLSPRVNVSEGINIVPVNVSSLQSGTFLMNVYKGDKIETTKLFKQ